MHGEPWQGVGVGHGISVGETVGVLAIVGFGVAVDGIFMLVGEGVIVFVWVG